MVKCNFAEANHPAVSASRRWITGQLTFRQAVYFKLGATQMAAVIGSGVDMRHAVFCLCLLLGLSGCISLGGGAPPQKTTIIVPQGATVSCTNQDGSACQPQ